MPLRAPRRRGHDRPVAAADAGLICLSRELFTISNLLKAADTSELEIDDLGLAAAISRYWTVVGDITGRVASTEHGRVAKLRAALIALNYEEETPRRVIALTKSALHDTVSHWDEQRSRERRRP